MGHTCTLSSIKHAISVKIVIPRPFCGFSMLHTEHQIHVAVKAPGHYTSDTPYTHTLEVPYRRKILPGENFRQFHHLFLLVKFLSAKFLSCVNVFVP